MNISNFENKLRKFINKIYRGNIRILLVLAVVFVIFTPFVFAQTTDQNNNNNTNNTLTTSNQVISKPQEHDTILSCNLTGLTQYLTPLFIYQDNGQYTSAACITSAIKSNKTLAQSDPGTAAKVQQLGLDPKQYVDGGILGLMAQVADYAYSGTSQNGPDAVTFIASKVTPDRVSAQSSALQGLSPILVLWGTLRNVTYILIALSLVITGLTMYFRKNQGKQDNFNVATSISDIIFTLITISLSYVIAGIAVDLVINVGNVAIATFFEPFINSTSILNNLYTPGTGTNIFGILNDFQTNGSSGSLINIAQQGLAGLSTPLQKTGDFVKSIPGAGFFFQPIAAIIYGIAQGVVSTVVSNELITAILAFTVFIIIFRIVFLLLGSFVGIIMNIAFAPLILIPGAFPGPSANGVFIDWLKKVLASALVFPVMFALLLLSAIFLNMGDNSGLKENNSNVCTYDNTSSSPVVIPGTGTDSTIFKTKRFQPSSSGTSETDSYGNIRKCFPILLPPKFNWLPAPIGNLGTGFDIDDFTRFVVSIAIIIVAPNITKAIQDALKIKPSGLASAKDAFQGAGVFNTFVGQIPIIGKPLSQVTSGITGAIK